MKKRNLACLLALAGLIGGCKSKSNDADQNTCSKDNNHQSTYQYDTMVVTGVFTNDWIKHLHLSSRKGKTKYCSGAISRGYCDIPEGKRELAFTERGDTVVVRMENGRIEHIVLNLTTARMREEVYTNKR